MLVLLFDDLNRCSFVQLKKYIGYRISKRISNIYHWEKLTFSKLRFSLKENLKKCTSFEEQKGARYIWGNVYFGIIVFSCFLSTKPCLRFIFAREIKVFYQSYLGNEADSKDVMSVSPNILAKNLNFKKLRHSFVDEREMITAKLISFCKWNTLVPFCLRKDLKMHF